MSQVPQDLPVPAGTFAGKVILLLGQPGSTTYAIAKAFRAAGAQLVVSGDGLEQVPSDLSLPKANVHPTAISGLFDTVEATFGPVDGLIIDRVASGCTAAEDILWKRWRAMNADIVDCIFLAGSEFARRCFARGDGGDILLLAAAQVIDGAAGNSLESAAASAIASLIKSWTVEWLNDDVRVNMIEVGLVEGLTNSISDLASRRGIDAVDTVPLARLGTADEVAAAALYLTSPYAAYIAGAKVRIDGGEWLRANLGGAPFLPPRTWFGSSKV